jgi:hypothetical protein
MISLQMQGGCLCENQPGLRLDTNNVEIAATIAPRPLLMVSATGDWTTNTMEREYPAVRAIYELVGAGDRVHGVRFDAPHNYNRESREAVYAWMARWLQQAPADVRREERPFTVDPLPDLLVFHQQPTPARALTAAAFTANWIDNARRQLSMTPLEVKARALSHALGAGDGATTPTATAGRNAQRKVLVAGVDAALERQLRASGFLLERIEFTPFDAEAAAKIEHFDTYNRTAASQRVADVVDALRASPGAALVAAGDDALVALLAVTVQPARAAVLDVGDFDTASDPAFVERLFIPGLRRAGDLSTATALAGNRVFIHNAGARFQIEAGSVRRQKLTAREIVELLKR